MEGYGRGDGQERDEKRKGRTSKEGADRARKEREKRERKRENKRGANKGRWHARTAWSDVCKSQRQFSWQDTDRDRKSTVARQGTLGLLGALWLARISGLCFYSYSWLALVQRNVDSLPSFPSVRPSARKDLLLLCRAHQEQNDHRQQVDESNPFVLVFFALLGSARCSWHCR